MIGIYQCHLYTCRWFGHCQFIDNNGAACTWGLSIQAFQWSLTIYCNRCVHRQWSDELLPDAQLVHVLDEPCCLL